MAFLSVYFPPLRGTRPALAAAENAHPLNDATTVWYGRDWENAIFLAVEWRVRMRDYATRSFEQYGNYDYSQHELF
jgi:hypothetical protein